eukprot:gene2719-3201_t
MAVARVNARVAEKTSPKKEDPASKTRKNRQVDARLKAFANSSHRASGAHIIEDEEIIAERAKSFVFSHGLTSEEAQRRLEKHGKNELPETIIPK